MRIPSIGKFNESSEKPELPTKLIYILKSSNVMLYHGLNSVNFKK